MLDLSLPPDELGKAIRDLVEQRVQEGRVLDYKESHYAPPGVCGSNKEIAKDISAFANAEGGQIIIGVEEDGRGIPVKADGAKRTGRDEAMRIENVATSGIQPKIGPLDVKTIEVRADREFLLVSIAQSISAPHMVLTDNDYRYYMRRNLKSEPMEESEVRLLYESRYRALERVDGFLNSLEWPRDWQKSDEPRMELVACPLFISEDRVKPADSEWVERAEGWRRRLEESALAWPVSDKPVPFKDGFVFKRTFCDDRSRKRVTNGQIEVFRSGCLRACLPAPTNNEGSLFGPLIAKHLREFTAVAARVLKEAGYFGEVRLRIGLHSAVGLSFFHVYVRQGQYLAPPIEPWPTWEEDEPIAEVISTFEMATEAEGPARRLADRLWNCVHLLRCDLWDESGNWLGGE